MAARTKKINTVETPADLEPVNLDPPDPALTRWQELSERDMDICHDGDASLVINTQRPAWSDPDEDIITRQRSQAVYMSAPARVALSSHRGVEYDDGDTLKNAALVVRAFLGHMYDRDLPGIQLKLVTGIKGKTGTDDKPWWHTTMYLAVSEVHELVEVLLAATDLVGGEK